MRQHENMGAPRARVAFSAAISALLALGLAGCDGGGGGSTGGSAGSAGSGGTGGTGGSASSCDPFPADVSSVQKLTVELQNKTAENRYLVTDCHECDLLRVEEKGDLDYVFLKTRITAAESCGCECPDPGDAYTAGVHLIAPGLTYTVTWDGRAFVTCTSNVDCGNGQTASTTDGALQPVGPGDYRVSFPIIVNLPAECMQSGATDDFTCAPPAMQGIDPGGGFYSVELTFADTGDVMKTLDIP